MLGKLIKHEFRATGRTMLPVLGIVIVLSMLGNVSLRLLNNDASSTAVSIFGVLFLSSAILSIFAALVLMVVIMADRFYTNLLGPQGYLMFTLPTDSHALVWSKLLVSLIWYLATALVAVFSMFILVFRIVDLRQVLSIQFVTAIIQEAKRLLDASDSQLILLVAQVTAAVLAGCIQSILHFYAAMAIGQTFPNHKGGLSVLFFFLLSFAMQIISTIFTAVTNLETSIIVNGLNSTQMLSSLYSVLLTTTLVSLCYSVCLYLITTLCLKKRLNLA